MYQTLAIGSFTETEAAALKAEFGAVAIAAPSELGVMEDAIRKSVRAVAYKGGKPFGSAEMDLLPSLGIISNFGVGYDAIDVSSATKRGIKVTNTPDVLNDDVADLAVAMMIMQGREMIQASEWAHSGNWASKGEYRLNRKVSGSTVGIVGFGRIGREIADRLAAFKMQIHYHSRTEKETPGWQWHADPVSLARAVDFLVVALVGGVATENYVSRQVIEALGPRGVVVNISRGSTVDEAALLEALESGKIAGAALDVFRNEPKIDPRFYALPNVVIQPHQGSGTIETRAAMAALQRRNIAAFLAGQTLETPVN